MNINKSLSAFFLNSKMNNKGALCVALVVTRFAKKKGLPLKFEDLLTKSDGQVLGLGKAAVQSILKEHGVTKILAEEGGRTSRGSVGNMKKYVSFLNELKKKGVIDIEYIEKWWVQKVKDFFSGKPFLFSFDQSKSLRTIIHDLINQAEKRQKQSKGATFAGTMLQHLVGAKLNILLTKPVEHHGASVSDDVSGREGDFIIEDVAIHVTTSPTEALIRKCARNLDKGLKPIIITLQKGAAVAEGLAEQSGILSRLDIFEAEQFLAGNLYELGKFAHAGRRTTAEQLIREYNSIIKTCETDPSLYINLTK